MLRLLTIGRLTSRQQQRSVKSLASASIVPTILTDTLSTHLTLNDISRLALIQFSL